MNEVDLNKVVDRLEVISTKVNACRTALSGRYEELPQSEHGLVFLSTDVLEQCESELDELAGVVAHIERS